MTLDEALVWSDKFAESLTPTTSTVTAFTLATEVRRLQAEIAALKQPARRAGKMNAPAQIAPTNWPYWMNETDEEFKAWGNAHTEVVG